MNVAIIGSQHHTASKTQLDVLQELFVNLIREHAPEYILLHHCDCIGVDQQCRDIAAKLNCITVCHPPLDKKYRAHTQNTVTLKPKGGLLLCEHEIVDDSSLVLICPNVMHLNSSCAMWDAYQYAANKENILIFPDGTTKLRGKRG